MPQEPRQDPPNTDDFHDDWQQRTPLELEDDRWDAFLPDDDREPHPEPGDFWIDVERQQQILGSFAVVAGIC